MRRCSWIVAGSAFLSAIGCGGAPAEVAAPRSDEPVSAVTAAPTGSQAEGSCAATQAQLRALADCVSRAVGILQREPERDELAAFLEAAQQKAPALSCPSPSPALVWSRDETMFDHFDDGSAQVTIEYRFTIDPCPPVTTQVELTMP
ncbi:MAG: hypothetical protein KC731_09535 [Myxococcales bacterium]|nr:hypothetical protein [Myxococcales bacterium]